MPRSSGKVSESQTIDELVTEQVNRTLQKGSLASFVMGSASGVLLMLMQRQGAIHDIDVPIIWTFIGSVYSLAIWLLARSKKIDGKTTYAVMLGFVTLPTTIYYISIFVLPSGTATYINGPPGYLYFFLIVITGFAFDFRLSLIAGCYAAIQYSFAAELAIPHLAKLTSPDRLMIQDLTQPSFYHFKSMMMAMTGFTVGIVGRHVRTLIHDTVAKEREKLMVSRLFGQFVSNEVKDKILTGTSAGERKSVAILFSDIRGFTSFSENVAPEEVVEYLNEYLNQMVTAINAAQGTIDKFIGDAIMAVFGGVLEVENSCDAAVMAALGMRQALTELNSIRTAKNLPAIQNGIGIHFGEVVQGAIGSAERKDFTVIGDAVNSASRIESACKDFDTDLLFSEAVYEKLSDDLKTRVHPAGTAKVKGRAQEIQLWTIL